jgi:hypothetical protein
MLHKKTIGIFLLLFISISSFSQSILSTSISLDVDKQRLEQVLEIISNKANFYFSYNSKIIQKDSLVSLQVHNKTIREILELLFNSTYELKESGNYLIITKTPIRLVMVTQKAVTDEKNYTVTGHVYDEQSGAALYEATIYEKSILAAALSSKEGYFKIKLKSSRTKFAELFISKEFYADTSVKIEPRHNQQLSVTMMPFENLADKVVIKPEDYFANDSLKGNVDSVIPKKNPSIKNTSKVEKRGLGKWLLSTRQKVQSLNLKNFFTIRPFQVSFTPWLGTHGKLSSQVVNNFSLNVLGGYTAGTNGLEIGGLFNIDKKEVKYVQVAGLFNSVGGKVTGVQLAGINNLVQDSVSGFQAVGISNYVKGKITGVQAAGISNFSIGGSKGLQIAGISNFSKKEMSGVQLAGIGNLVLDSVNGYQVAGISNYVKGKVTGVQIAGINNHSIGGVKGVQIAGIANIGKKEINGVQIAGIFNYTKKLKGLQVGLINIADSSEGYSIGLINIVLNGYHKLSIYNNEVMNVNAAFKTGNRKLYSILLGGAQLTDSNKIYSYGYGIGSEFLLNKRKTISLNTEITSQYLYLGSWDYTNLLNRLNLNFTIKLTKYISLFAGPSFSVYVSNQKTGIQGYKFPVMAPERQQINFSNNVKGWFGWNVGINFF